VDLGLGELWRHAGLITLLIWRELKIRYEQTVTGFVWVILQPLVTTVVFSVLFGKLVGVRSDGLPYPVFAYSALVPWTYFVHALTKSTTSLVSFESVITKVYFPRLAIPVAAVLAGLVDFLIVLVGLAGMMLFYGIVPTVAIWTLPLFTLFAVAAALGVGLWLAALNVQYRDVANALPFVIQLWFFVTPIAYPSSLIPEPWRAIYGLNPMAGVVEGFRWAVLGHGPVPVALVTVSALTTVGLLLGGLYYFRRKEDLFADVV